MKRLDLVLLSMALGGLSSVAASDVHHLRGVAVAQRAEGGVVFTSADASNPRVLGYTDSGTLDLDDLPLALTAWLDEITACGAADIPQAPGSVDQLLGDIAWTQDQPMNDLCPRYSYLGYDYPTYAGCVAVALGQIMCYHGYPDHATGNISYTTDTYDLPVASNLGSHTYDWNRILPNYIYTSATAEQRAEVARLVFDVAAACYTDFSPAGSTSEDYRAAKALKTNFGYDPSLRLVDHADYTTAEWAALIRSEIDARRPVYVSGINVRGDGSAAGHAFVIDGYNADGYFHVNWGWNGTSNGYYLLTDLTPRDSQGIGGSAAGYAFMQNAIVGIQPDCGGVETPATLTLHYDQIWTETDEAGLAIHFQICNRSATDFKGYIALRITDPDGLVLNDPMATALHTQCKSGAGGERAWYVDLASLGNRPDLRFDIVYQREGEEEWLVAGSRLGSPHSLLSYVTAGGSIALHTDPEQMFQLRLADLHATSALKAGSVATFTATVRNLSPYEYFAPLYLMVYNPEGTALVGYTDYQLNLVPSMGEAEVQFTYRLPSDEGRYHFCVAYETLGYNYDYTPMLLSDREAYDYVFLVESNPSDGGGDDPDTGGGDTGNQPQQGVELSYVMECIDYGFDAVRRDVKVRFEGSDVYIQGISAEVPTAWAHAVISDGVAVFDAPQLLGQWTYNLHSQNQYLTGADTNTGDVSGLAMAYDPQTHSFMAYSNNWILLTSTPDMIGYYYDHLYQGVTILPQSQAGDDPSVTPPAGLTTVAYLLSGRNPFTHIPSDFTLQVGFSGDEVYVQGLYPALPKSWVKGTLSGSTVTFQSPQYVGNYHGLYNMFVAGWNPLADTLTQLVMHFDTSSRTFTSVPDCQFFVQAGEGEPMAMMHLDGITMRPYTMPVPDYGEVQLPSFLEENIEQYDLSAINVDDNHAVASQVSAVVSGYDVWVRGLSAYFPDVWVKGHIDEWGICVFDRNQHMGMMGDYHIWLGGGDVTCGEILYGDFILIYDRDSGVFTQPEVNYLAINASTTDVYHLELYRGVALTPHQSSAIEQTRPASLADSQAFDLYGRRITGRVQGVQAVDRRLIIKR
ncbi:MAG: C10 family peptidase [Bacteroidales bacterium]|nr:C10 family peptidase [Candidatus Liminaster caballi]